VNKFNVVQERFTALHDSGWKICCNWSRLRRPNQFGKNVLLPGSNYLPRLAEFVKIIHQTFSSLTSSIYIYIYHIYKRVSNIVYIISILYIKYTHSDTS